MNSAHGPCACAARSRSNATSCSAWWHSRSIKYSASRSSGPRRPERRPLQPREHRENSPRSMNFARASGEMPKEGTDSFTNTWLITTSNTMKVGERTLGTYEVSGVHQNVHGEATNDMGMRCLGIYDVAGKAREWKEHGACTFT